MNNDRALDNHLDTEEEREYLAEVNKKLLALQAQMRDKEWDISALEDELRDLERDLYELQKQRDSLEDEKKKLRIKLGIDPCPGQLKLSFAA